MPEKSAFWAVWRSSFTFCDNLSQNTVRAKRPPGAGRRFRRVAASAKTGGRRRECTHADVSGKKLICVRRPHEEEGAFAQPVRRRRGRRRWAGRRRERTAAWRWPPEQAAGNRRTAGVNGFATCRLWRQPVAPGEERAAHLSRPPDGWDKGAFAPFWGLGQKGVRRGTRAVLC